HEEEAGLGTTLVKLAEGLDQRFVAAPCGQAGHAADQRRVTDGQLLADLECTRGVWSEARHIDDPVAPREAIRGDAGPAGAALDGAADCAEGIAPPVERAIRPSRANRSLVVEAPDESGTSPAPPAEPVVVAVVGVQDIHALAHDERTEASRVRDNGERPGLDVEAEAFERPERPPPGPSFATGPARPTRPGP